MMGCVGGLVGLLLGFWVLEPVSFGFRSFNLN